MRTVWPNAKIRREGNMLVVTTDDKEVFEKEYANDKALWDDAKSPLGWVEQERLATNAPVNLNELKLRGFKPKTA